MEDIKDPYTGRRIMVREGSYASRTVKKFIGTDAEGVVFDWFNDEELNGDIVLEVRFEGFDIYVLCEPHEVDFVD